MLRLWKLAITGSVTPSPANSGCAAAIGNFDGVHRGHQMVIVKLVAEARARGLISSIISFYPHPSIALGRASHANYLCSLRQKIALLRDLGVDQLILLHFNAFLRELSAQQFVEKVLVEKLNVQHLILGYDTRIGKGRSGDATLITAALAASGRSAETLEKLDLLEEVVSSRRIRAALEAGDLNVVQGLLGRRYSVMGRVVHGDGRGRTIGFATANLKYQQQLLPPNGVYAGFASVHRAVFKAVTNVGVRPTVSTGATTVPSVEVHLLGFNEPLYGSRLTFEFVQRIRDERKFESLAALKAQIGADCSRAAEIL